MNSVQNVSNSTVVIGDNNTVTASQENSEKLHIDWAKAEAKCLETLVALPQNSSEYQATKALFADINNKNTGGMKNTILKYAKSFTSQLFFSTASVFLVDLIKAFLCSGG